jgi:hypothetical protein
MYLFTSYILLPPPTEKGISLKCNPISLSEMGEASLTEELRHGKSPRTRGVAGRSAGFQFGPPFGHRRISPAECSGDFLQLPGKGKWPASPRLTLSKVLLLLRRRASRIFALEQIGSAEIQSKSGSK